MDRPVVDAPLVVFDGVCGMCNRFIVAVLRRDVKGVLRFTSNSSPFAKRVLAQFAEDNDAQRTIMVLDEGQLLKRSDAVLCIARHLGFPYSVATIFRIVPRVVRDWVYDLIARNRYRFFSKVEECQLIPAELRSRIMTEERGV